VFDENNRILRLVVARATKEAEERAKGELCSPFVSRVAFPFKTQGGSMQAVRTGAGVVDGHEWDSGEGGGLESTKLC
jgi:hypothetical protein